MSKCDIDHSLESVHQKLENQKPHLSENLYQQCQDLLSADQDQHTLNELFHLLKKYDLADQEEKEERNRKIESLGG